MAFRMRWPTRQGIIRQRFGEHPAIYSKFGLPGHEGVDLAAPYASEIFTVADGFVSDVRLDGFADPMLKPYGNQVRVQHADGYQTIYAHLCQVVVVRGQLVQAKQLIALSGDTGHAADAHLHLSLKHHGATVAGLTEYPYDLVDPEPFLVDYVGDQSGILDPPDATMQVVVTSEDADSLYVLALPRIGAQVITQVDDGALLDTFEDPAAVKSKAGQDEQWLWVRTADGDVGWVAAWCVALPDGQLEPKSHPDTVVFVIVDSQDEALQVYAGPGTQYDEVTRCLHGTLLKTLDGPDVVEKRVGQRGEWLHVQTPLGEVGHCAASYVKLGPFGEKAVIPEPPTGEPTAHVVVESPDLGLRLRAGPGAMYDRIWSMPHKTVLTSLEDPVTTGKKVGCHGEWIHVRTPALYEGYAAAWYLRYPEQQDERQPASPDGMRTGVSPHIFGIHALSVADDPYGRDRIRGLYDGTGKQGWILFTEICGRHADTINQNPEIRRRLWDWAEAGYGVIVRLNYGYEPGGTLPESRFYDDYAAAAARWVEVHLKEPGRSSSSYTWTIQIGNEQNNPREHPGGFEHPIEHITAANYADAFNRTYARIKKVLPNATVCPGALDPYNYSPMRALGNERWRPLDYFTMMMDRIEALDGIILHAYTHGPALALVTHLKRFGDGTGPLGDHYYDFQTYRVFMERIPAQWRDLPVYITEMDHIHLPAGEHDQGWVNQNVGWVRAAYAEIDRWNQMPYAQQIRCGLLYRWMGDAWAIERKPEILTDFRQSLANDYRWRRMPSGDVFNVSMSGGWGSVVRPVALEERFLVHPDDLTRIWGVGDKAQSALRAAGIMIYEQLAQLSSSELVAILEETGLRARYLTTWPEQARLAAGGEWDKLASCRDRLS